MRARRPRPVAPKGLSVTEPAAVKRVATLRTYALPGRSKRLVARAGLVRGRPAGAEEGGHRG